MCPRSAEKTERCSRRRRHIAAITSVVGILVKRITRRSLLYSKVALFLEHKRGRTETAKPRVWLPASPRKIFALGLFQNKKPKIHAARIKHISILGSCIKIIMMPIAMAHKKEMPPQRQSRPSIRLKALTSTRIRKKVSKRPNQAGKVIKKNEL